MWQNNRIRRCSESCNTISQGAGALFASSCRAGLGPKSSEAMALRRWLHLHGSLTVHHDLSFQYDMDLLRNDSQWGFSQNVLGSWLRVDFPNVLKSVEKLQNAPQIPKHLRAYLAAVGKEYVLWTDPDVLFLGQIDSCTLSKPQVLSVGPEVRMGFPETTV